MSRVVRLEEITDIQDGGRAADEISVDSVDFTTTSDILTVDTDGTTAITVTSDEISVDSVDFAIASDEILVDSVDFAVAADEILVDSVDFAVAADEISVDSVDFTTTSDSLTADTDGTTVFTDTSGAFSVEFAEVTEERTDGRRNEASRGKEKDVGRKREGRETRRNAEGIEVEAQEEGQRKEARMDRSSWDLWVKKEEKWKDKGHPGRARRPVIPDPWVDWETQSGWLREFEEGLVVRHMTDCWPKYAEMNAMEAGSPESDGELQQAFGNTLGFPTCRRPAESRRALDSVSTDKVILEWFGNQDGKDIQVGGHLTAEERSRALRLLYTWKDRFCSDVRELPATDLIEHRIPTVKCRPVRMKPKLYTQKEVEWQKKHLPALLEAGIIDWVNSPWSAGCKFPVKKNGDLRMVHVYCPINDATIKTNYPMKRTEPIINAMALSRFKCYWWADGANGYWAIPMYRPHAFKTAFSSVLGQFAYLRMGQGLTGAPHTYAQLKDLVMGPIPEPMGERPLSGETEEFAFMTFFDDDMGATTSFEAQLEFLHHHYFPRMHWARLVLNPAKSHFFMPRIEMLGLQADSEGVRPSHGKLEAFREYPSPSCEKELDQFEYMTTYLRKFIPGRADHFRKMRTAVITVPEFDMTATSKPARRKVRMKTVDFQWN
jgi:hypothetical protein